MNKLVKKLLPVIIVIIMLFVMSVSASAVSGNEIVAYARQYIGCAYVHGGQGPTAFDCSGFVHYVFAHFGIDLPTSSSSYYSNPTKYGTVIGTGSTANAKAGDVISWSGHVAIYTENGKCVEALNSKYGVTESIAVNSHTNGMNYKVIRINGVDDAKPDTEAPKISNAKASDITFTSFQVNCTLSDNTGVDKAVISVNGPKTTKTFTVNSPASTFSYTVDASKIDGAGNYKATITAYDAAGNQASATIDKITVAAHDHVLISKTTKEATCTQTGTKTLTCSCGYSTTETIPAKGHVNGDWKVTKEPTTSKSGERSLYCSVCKQVIKTETLPKLSAQNGSVYNVNVNDFSMYYKKKFTLSPEITADSNAKYTVTYVSSDPGIASVDSNGNVSALKRGTSTITVKVTDNQGHSITDTCKVTVKFSTAQCFIWLFALGFIWY